MTNELILKKEEAFFLLDEILGKNFPTKNARIGRDILATILTGAVEDELHHCFISWPNILYYPHDKMEEIPDLTEYGRDVVIRRIRSVLKYSWEHEGEDSRVETLGYFYPIRPEPKEFVYGLLTYMMTKAHLDGESPKDQRIRQEIFGCVRPGEVRTERDFSILVTIVDYLQKYYYDEKPVSFSRYLRAACTANLYPERISKFLQKINWSVRFGFKDPDLAFDTRPQKFVECWLALLHAAD